MPRTPRYTIRQVADALRDGGGLHSRAARVLGCHPATVGKYVARNRKLQEIKELIVEDMLDHAEEKLRDLVDKGHIAATIFTLKTLGKRRGYVERQEVAVAVEVRGVHAPPAPATYAEWREIQQEWANSEEGRNSGRTHEALQEARPDPVNVSAEATGSCIAEATDTPITIHRNTPATRSREPRPAPHTDAAQRRC